MRDAVKVSNKQNETPHADVKVGDVVPHEHAYSVELYELMAAGLPPSFTKDVEVNAPNTKNGTTKTRADIIVTNNRMERVVVETMAHDRDEPETRASSVLGHVQRCAKSYTKMEGVKEAWVCVLPFSVALHLFYFASYHILLINHPRLLG
jgi:hypothetical protein